MIKPKPLSVRGVLKVLKEIAKASGKDVQTVKKEKIKQMLVSAQEKEAQYIVRALQGKMRIGASEQTVLVTLSNPSPTPYPQPPTPYPLPPTP